MNTNLRLSMIVSALTVTSDAEFGNVVWPFNDGNQP